MRTLKKYMVLNIIILLPYFSLKQISRRSSTSEYDLDSEDSKKEKEEKQLLEMVCKNKICT